MTKGELEYAIRQALNNFDKWNDCTGAMPKGTSWYYEAQSCIEDAVKIGAKVACEGIDADLSDIFEDEKEQQCPPEPNPPRLQARKMPGGFWGQLPYWGLVVLLIVSFIALLRLEFYS